MSESTLNPIAKEEPMPEPFILVVNPWIHDFAAYDLWVRPLGLMTIAQLLKKNGFGLQMINCLDTDKLCADTHSKHKPPVIKKTGRGHFLKTEIQKPPVLEHVSRKYSQYGIPDTEFMKQLQSMPEPDLILVTSIMTYWYPGVFKAISMMRQFYPRTPIFLGGIYSSLCSKHAIKHSGADRVFRTSDFGDFVRSIEKISGKKIQLFQDDFLFNPDYSIMSGKKAIPLITSRGCPFKCTYCASAQLHNGFLQYDPAKVAGLIEQMVTAHGSTDFIFYDDALLVNASTHIIPLLKMVLERQIKVRFHVPNGLHIRHLTHEVAELMIETGFKTLRLGLESSDPEVLKHTGNKVSQNEFITAAEILKDVGFRKEQVGVYLLAGLPLQRFEQVYDSIMFVIDNSLRPYIAEYSPIPETSLWQKALNNSSYPLANEPLFHNNSLLPCQWEGFTAHDLEYLKKASRAG